MLDATLIYVTVARGSMPNNIIQTLHLRKFTPKAFNTLFSHLAFLWVWSYVRTPSKAQPPLKKNHLTAIEFPHL